MAGTASVAGEVFVDALPYFDQGYDAAGVREAVSSSPVCRLLLTMLQSEPLRRLVVVLVLIVLKRSAAK